MKFLIALTTLIVSLTSFAETNLNIYVSLTPAGSFTANSKAVKGKLIKTNNEFTAKKISVAIKTLKTGIDLRDEHFHKHLNTKTAVLTELKGANGKATGILEINGTKKPIEITYTEKENEVIAKFKTTASAFNLPPKSYLGVGVNDEVEVEVQLPFKSK